MDLYDVTSWFDAAKESALVVAAFVFSMVVAEVALWLWGKV